MGLIQYVQKLLRLKSITGTAVLYFTEEVALKRNKHLPDMFINVVSILLVALLAD